MSTQAIGAPLIKDSAKVLGSFGFKRCFPVSVARSVAGLQATGTTLVGVGDGEAVLASEVGVLPLLGVLLMLGLAVSLGVAEIIDVAVVVDGLTSVELLDPADGFGPLGGGSSAAAGDPTELITIVITMITTIKTTPRITTRRTQ